MPYNQILPKPSTSLISKTTSIVVFSGLFEYSVKRPNRIRLSEENSKETSKNHFGFSTFILVTLNDTCKLILPSKLFSSTQTFFTIAVGKCISQSYFLRVLVLQSMYLWQCCLTESSQQKPTWYKHIETYGILSSSLIPQNGSRAYSYDSGIPQGPTVTNENPNISN